MCLYIYSLQKQRHIYDIKQVITLLSLIDRTDDQRGGVFTTIIRTGTEEWVEFLSEGAASKGVDKSCSIYIIKGDPTLLIIHKHPHLLRLRLQRETD